MLQSLSARTLLLIDAIGAFITFFMLVLVLPAFNNLIGIPEEVLYALAILPAALALFSFSIFLRFPEKWYRFMLMIAIANMLYGVSTLILLAIFSQEVKSWGYVYFIGEVLIISFLARLEYQTVKLHMEG